MIWIETEQTELGGRPSEPLLIISVMPDSESKEDLALVLAARELQLAGVKLARRMLRSAIKEIDAYVFSLLYNLEEQESVKGEMSDGE